MGNKTAISWTHRTMNPYRIKGSKAFYCVKRSPACDHCYAEIMSRRLAAMGHTTFYPYKVMKELPELELDRELLASWKRSKKSYLNFVTSMTDIFGEFVKREWMYEVLDAMVAASKQVFQVLTKREDIMLEVVNEYCRFRGIDKLPENIWIGITVESQKWYNHRVYFLLRAKVSVRWLSMEPLLGPVDLQFSGTVPKDWGYGYCHVGNLIHWVVVGGESGLSPKKIRPPHPDWFRSLRDQCFMYDVPFFFKQWGNWNPVEPPKEGDKGHFAFHTNVPGAGDMPKFKKPSTKTFSWLTDEIKEWKIGERVAQWMKWTKKKDGDILDGKRHQELPAITEYLLANK